MMNNTAKNFDIPTTSLRILHNYFDSPTIIFRSVSNQIFRFFSKIFFRVQIHFVTVTIILMRQNTKI